MKKQASSVKDKRGTRDQEKSCDTQEWSQFTKFKSKKSYWLFWLLGFLLFVNWSWGAPWEERARPGKSYTWQKLANTSRLMKFPRNFLHVGLEGSYWSILTWHHEGRLWLVRGCEQAGSSTEASLHKNILAAEISSVSVGHVLHFYKKHIGGFTLSQTTDTPQGWTHTMVIFQQV